MAGKSFSVIFIFVVLAAALDYSYALTPEQVLKLRQAGVEDKTIRLMIKQEREAGGNPADLIGAREVTDQAGNTAVVYSTGRSSGAADQAEQEKVDKAWKMLQNMIIDNRK